METKQTDDGCSSIKNAAWSILTLKVGLKLHGSQLHHFFQSKSSSRKKKCFTCKIWMEGRKRNDPQNCTTDFVQNNSMLTCGNLENINQIFLALTKLPKLMHHGHQDSWELFVSQYSYVTSEAERFQASKKISSRVSIQLPMTARVKILLKIWWTSSLCKLSGNTQIAAFTSPHSFPLWKLLF